MGNLIFLVGALVLSVVGSVWLWLRHRPPTSVMSSIDGFRDEMSALAGERPPASNGSPTRRPGARPHAGRPATGRPAGRPPTPPPSAQRPPSRRSRVGVDGDPEQER